MIHNNLQDIEFLGKVCPYLQILDLSNNQITDLSELMSLESLKSFDVSHNKIKKLPSKGWA